MLPLRLLVTSHEALSLPERARALVLAREAGILSARLLGPGCDRASGVRVWQRLVLEEALLRGLIDTDAAFALMRQALADDAVEPRLEVFLSAWMGYADPGSAPPRPGHPARGLARRELQAQEAAPSPAGARGGA